MDLAQAGRATPDELWDVLIGSDREWADDEFVQRSARAATTPVLEELAQPGQRSLHLARRALLDGQKLEEKKFLRDLRRPSPAAAAALRALPAQPSGILTVLGTSQIRSAGRVARRPVDRQEGALNQP